MLIKITEHYHAKKCQIGKNKTLLKPISGLKKIDSSFVMSCYSLLCISRQPGRTVAQLPNVCVVAYRSHESPTLIKCQKFSNWKKS